MSTKYKFYDPEKSYFVSFAVVYWIDLFVRNEYKSIILDSWKYCQNNKGLEINGWCIMTSHVHLLIGAHKNSCSNILRDMKKFTSEKLREAIVKNTSESRKEWMLRMIKQAGKENSQNGQFQVWQQNNHPIELSTLKIAHQKLDYIHYNPVVSGIVRTPEDYIYSSAADYSGRKGLIDVSLLDPLCR